ncbi:MAG: hypothetical protein R6V10_12765 [bacterium]
MIKLSRPPVGIAFLGKDDPVPDVAEYEGISFCDAVRRSVGGPLLLRPGSISTCRWSPPVLGLKKPETDFEKGLEPRLEDEISAVLVSRLSEWPLPDRDPDVVIIRTGREDFARLIQMVPPDRVFGRGHGADRTAVPLLLGKRSFRSSLIRASNRLLERLGRNSTWHRFTVWTFRREWTSRALNYVLDRSMANMSMCRNSSVIPYLTGRLNVSHFCTGGISWGGNPPHCLTGGLPFDLFKELEKEFEVKEI